MPVRALRLWSGVTIGFCFTFICQNQKMPVRALRRLDGNWYNATMPNGSESKNARKGIKTMTDSTLAQLNAKVGQNQKMPVRALRLNLVVIKRLIVSGSESKNARKGIKTRPAGRKHVPAPGCQNQKMPVRALRRTGRVQCYQSPRTASESKNARKGIKTVRRLCRF